MTDANVVLSSKPRDAMLSAATDILGIKVSKSVTSGRLSLSELQDRFHTKLGIAYDFEEILLRLMPKLCSNYMMLKEKNLREISDEFERWKHKDMLTGLEYRFNLFFRVFIQYKTAKKQSVSDEKRALITTLLSLDDVELWEKQHEETRIHNVSDLILWYNANIDPFSAILIDTNIIGEI